LNLRLVDLGSGEEDNGSNAGRSEGRRDEVLSLAAVTMIVLLASDESAIVQTRSAHAIGCCCPREKRWVLCKELQGWLVQAVRDMHA